MPTETCPTTHEHAPLPHLPTALPPATVPSFSNYLHQHPLPAAAIKFAVENLFPRAEVELAFSNRDYNFAAHKLPFDVGVAVVFAGEIVSIVAGGFVWRELRGRLRSHDAVHSHRR